MSIQVRIVFSSVYPEKAFEAIEKYISVTKVIDKYNRLYPSESKEDIRTILIKDCALTENEDFWLIPVKD